MQPDGQGLRRRTLAAYGTATARADRKGTAAATKDRGLGDAGRRHADRKTDDKDDYDIGHDYENGPGGAGAIRDGSVSSTPNAEHRTHTGAKGIHDANKHEHAFRSC